MSVGSRIKSLALGGVFVGLSVAAFALPASASTTQTIYDTYYGGLNTYNSPADIIGGPDFNISKMDVTRTNNDLNVVVYTNFVSHIGEDGVGLGALFLGNESPTTTPLAYNNTTYNSTNGTYSSTPATAADAPHYANDTYAADPGRFQFAASLPTTTPTLSSGTASGSGGFYQLATGANAGSDVVLSNVYNNNVTHGFTGGSGSYYFRQGQAVGVTSAAALLTGNAVNWSIDANAGTLTFNIANAFGTGLLNDSFSLAWEMTCANDVMLASVDLPTGAVSTTPLPASLPLFLSGIGVVSFFSRKRRKKLSAAAA